MIASSNDFSDSDDQARKRLIVADIGNTTTSIGLWWDGAVMAVQRCATGDEERFREIWPLVLEAYGDSDWPVVVMSSVVPEASDLVGGLMESLSDIRPVVVGDTIGHPLKMDVEEVDRVGVDRVCAAAGAFERYRQACVVADVGTAVTVDLVSDDGVFLGGAIFPGVGLQARALGESTAQLPMVGLEKPESPVGRSTERAICSGLYYGVLGAVRMLVEEYATLLGHWPNVVATGGGVELLREADFVDAVMPDLGLVGVGLAWRRHGATDGDK